MLSTCTQASAEAWLEWFEACKAIPCRTYLCTTYGLNAIDAEALINTARLQVFLHWDSLENPLAYFWHTLKHAAGKQGQHHARERQRLAAYAQQRQVHDDLAARTAQRVADLLERVSLRQRSLLAWFLQGYNDTQVAAWLETTPLAVRVGRHSAYRTLRAQFRSPKEDASMSTTP